MTETAPSTGPFANRQRAAALLTHAIYLRAHEAAQDDRTEQVTNYRAATQAVIDDAVAAGQIDLFIRALLDLVFRADPDFGRHIEFIEQETIQSAFAQYEESITAADDPIADDHVSDSGEWTIDPDGRDD